MSGKDEVNNAAQQPVATEHLNLKVKSQVTPI